MTKIPKIITVSELRRGAARLLARVQDHDEPVVVTQRGQPSAVILSIEAYERFERERKIVRVLAHDEHEVRVRDGASPR